MTARGPHCVERSDADRAALRDVLAVKAKLDAQRAAMEALADDAEDIQRCYGV